MGYDNGKIYVLRSNQTDDIYIGSTTQPLYKRIHQHKKDFRRWKNEKRNYVTSFELMKYDDAYIELLELCPCDSKMELCRREGQLQREMNCVNKEIAGRTQKEWCDDNKDKIKMREKIYREENKDKMKEWRQENKDKIRELSKKYNETHKDKIKEHNTKYRQANKEKLNHKINCECGGKYTYKVKSIHFKTQKHQAYVCLNE